MHNCHTETEIKVPTCCLTHSQHAATPSGRLFTPVPISKPLAIPSRDLNPPTSLSRDGRLNHQANEAVSPQGVRVWGSELLRQFLPLPGPPLSLVESLLFPEALEPHGILPQLVLVAQVQLPPVLLLRLIGYRGPEKHCPQSTHTKTYGEQQPCLPCRPLPMINEGIKQGGGWGAAWGKGGVGGVGVGTEVS